MRKAKAIKKIMIDHDMSAKELAAKLNISSSGFSKRMAKDDFLESELEEIARTFGLRYVSYFETKNGDKYQ